MKIENSTIEDLPKIFELYRIATNYQKQKWPGNVWPEFEVEMVKGEIKEKKQWKLTIDNKIACIWATTFSDPVIWEEKNIDPSVYIHRIATNPKFKGQKLVEKIVEWSKEYAIQNQKEFIRMDTCGRNESLINHYTNCSFEFLGIHKLKSSDGLPSHYIDADVCFFQIKIGD